MTTSSSSARDVQRVGDGFQSRSRPLRVFHLIKSLGRGGAEMLLPEGLRHADRERFEYGYGYFLPWKDSMVPALEEQGVEVRCFGGRNNLEILLAARRLTSHLRRERVDVLHCHLPIAGVVGRLAGRMAGVPVVYTEHNKQDHYHGATKWTNAYTWNWQAYAIAVSGDVEASIRKHIESRVPLRTVLNGVDVDRFHRPMAGGDVVRRQYGIAPDAPVVGTVAVFREQKRLGDWIEAAQRLYAERPEVRFLLVGDGPMRPAIEREIAGRQLEGIVHLCGLQENVRPFMAAMDVYMMSSSFEGLPVALLEAMSMQCVPVSTRVGGIPELVRDGENGFLTDAHAPQQLARAVAGLLGDRERLAALAAAARRSVEEGFSIRRMTRELESIYLEVTGGLLQTG